MEIAVASFGQGHFLRDILKPLGTALHYTTLHYTALRFVIYMKQNWKMGFLDGYENRNQPGLYSSQFIQSDPSGISNLRPERS